MLRKLFTLAAVAALSACATAKPLMQEADGSYRIEVENGAASSPSLLLGTFNAAAKMECPAGWTVISEGTLPQSQNFGGHWWRFKCAPTG